MFLGFCRLSPVYLMFEVFAACALYGGFMRRFHRDKKGHVEVLASTRGPTKKQSCLFVEKRKTQQRKYIIIDIALRFLIYLLIVIRVASSVCHQRV